MPSPASGAPPGRRFGEQRYLRDLYPTVCELAGVPVPGTVEGRSVVPVLRGEAASVHECLFGYFRNVQRMVRTDRWKLIEYPQIHRYQLFDLSRDPDEVHDLSADAEYAEQLRELRRKLKAWQQRMGDPLLGKSRKAP